MTTNRRNFLRNSLLGTGMLATGLAGHAATLGNETFSASKEKSPKQRFNMSGYAAPKLDKVRIGFVGLGMRGPGAVERMSYIEGVEIIALCDVLRTVWRSARKFLNDRVCQKQNRIPDQRKRGKRCAKIPKST